MKGLLLLAVLAGCDADVCAKFDGQACISLEVKGTPTVDQIGVEIDGILTEQLTPTPPRDTPVSLPVYVAILPGDNNLPATLDLNVRGLRFGLTVGQAPGQITLQPKEHRLAEIDLTDLTQDLGGVDLSQSGTGPAFVPANQGLNGGGISVILAGAAADSAFAGTTGAGLFKTTNRGASWAPANQGLDGRSIVALASDDIHFTLYVSVAKGDGTGAIFKSTDDGGSWTKVTNQLAQAILPTSDSLASPVLLLGTSTGVLRSTDGVSFTPVNNGLTDVNVISLLDDLLNKGRIYAGTLGQKVFESNDFGSTWTDISTGIGAGGGNGTRSLALEPSSGDLIAATGAGLFRRSGANAFVAVSPAPPSQLGAPTELAFVQQSPTSLYVSSLFGLFHLDTSWSNVSSGLTDTDVTSVSVDRQNSNIVWSGTLFGGAFVSANAGASWSSANTGITNLAVESLAIAPSSPNVVYAGSQHDGVWKSTDGGSSWSQISSGLPAGVGVRALAVHPSNPLVAFAAMDDTSASGIAGLAASDDGLTWSRPETTIHATSIVIDPRNPQSIFVALNDGTIRQSTNGGLSFPSVGVVGGSVSSLVMDPTSSQILYAGSLDHGVFRSSDGGAHWTSATTGISEAQINSLAIADGTHLFAAGFNGVYRSTDAAASWQPVTTGLGGQGFEVIRAASASVVYTASNAGIFRSDDGGQTWSFRDSSPFLFTVRDLAIDPRNANTAYFAFVGGPGILKTTTGGR